jgi:hypothetical protein
VRIPGASGSPDAAVAAAAHHMLVKRFPSLTTSLDTTYHTYMTSHGLSETDPGVAVGEAAADGVIALRATDGSFPDCSPMPPPPLCRFVGSTDIGVWRPTPSFLPGPPPSNSPMLAPWLSVVTPFTLTSNSQFRAVPPPVSHQQALRCRLQRGQVPRSALQQRPYCRANRDRFVLVLELPRALVSGFAGHRCRACAQH